MICALPETTSTCVILNLQASWPLNVASIPCAPCTLHPPTAAAPVYCPGPSRESVAVPTSVLSSHARAWRILILAAPWYLHTPLYLALLMAAPVTATTTWKLVTGQLFMPPIIRASRSCSCSRPPLSSISYLGLHQLLYIDSWSSTLRCITYSNCTWHMCVYPTGSHSDASTIVRFMTHTVRMGSPLETVWKHLYSQQEESHVVAMTLILLGLRWINIIQWNTRTITSAKV